jgi:ABC-type nitrate/sulfonate/bicarbonate transport system substrate-binding protein
MSTRRRFGQWCCQSLDLHQQTYLLLKGDSMRVSNNPRLRRGFRFGAALACASTVVLVAGCSSGTKASSPTSAAAAVTSAAASASSPISGIAGARFTLMFQSTQAPGEVVEVHAINLLKAEGVNATAKWNASTSNVAITELTNGDIDAYSQAVTGALSAALAGVKIKDFALAQPRQDYVLLANKKITSLADLKGKSIGVSSITGVNYAQALLVLQKAGLKASDVHVVVAGGQSTRVSGLAAGRVDATMLNHAAAVALNAQGFTTLFDYTKQAPNLYDDNVFATPTWLAKNPNLAVAFNKALLDSFVWFNDPANTDAVVAEAQKLDPASDAKSLASQFATLRADGWCPNGSILDPTLLDEQQKLYVQTGAVKATVPLDQWVDDSFAKQAKGL